MAARLAAISKMFTSQTNAGTFNRVFKKVVLVSCSDQGQCVLEMVVDKEHLNSHGTLHGGLTASLVDKVTTLALLAAGKPSGVSVELSVSYLRAAKPGSVLIVTGECPKIGSTLAFTTCDIKLKDSGKLIAQGKHLKHIAGGKLSGGER